MPSRATSLRVATLNVWGHPDVIGRHLMPRMDAIAALAAELELDLLAIQESWTVAGRERLVAGLREAGLPQVWHRPQGFGGSGLLLAARSPLRAVRFERFRLSGLPQRLDHGDWYSGKGAVVATLDTDAGPVDVLNTHLVAHYERTPHDAYYGHRVGQIVEIAQRLAGSPRPLVALGDFNVREDGPEYPILTGLTGLVDAAVALDARQDTILTPHPYRLEPGAFRIDYVFTRDGRGVSTRAATLRRAFDAALQLVGEDAAYSDHAGLVADVTFEAAANTRSHPGATPAARELAREALARGRAIGASRHGEQRGAAAAGFGLAGACALGRPHTRRAWLQRTLVLGAGIAACGGAGAFLLAESLASDERRAYGELEAVLGALPVAPSGGADSLVAPGESG